MEHRRSWTATLDGVERRIDVVYKAMSGWMSIEVRQTLIAIGWFTIVIGVIVVATQTLTRTM
jgi:hypothetical protein